MPQKQKAPSQRQLRVGEQLRHLLAEALRAGHVRDPDLRDASITVTEVRVSPDLKNATAFVMPLAGRDLETVIAALGRAAPFFRRELAREAQLRYAPRLTFQPDRSFAEAERINTLLQGARVRRDLEESPDDVDGDDGQGEADGPAS